MRTPDMSDEELDRLFRHGAEAYPDEVSLTGWLKVEEQLDTAAQQQQLQQLVRRRVARLFVAEVALVLLLVGLWQATGGRTLWTDTSAATAKTSSGLVPGHSPTVTTRSQPANQPPQAASSASPLPIPRDGVGREEQLAAPSQRATSRTTAVADKALAADHRQALLLAVVHHRPPAKQATHYPEQTGSVLLSAAPMGAAEVATARPAVPETGTQPIPETLTAASVPAADTDSLLAPQVLAAAPSPPVALTDTTLHRPLRLVPTSRLLLGLTGGPEATALLPGPAPRVGGTVGVLLEYRVLPRWRVRTGLVRSVKRYAAHGADYNPPPDYWTHRIPIDQVEANCRILEIPLDVRYDAILRPTHTFYATAGLTSLFMRNERYTYLYELNGRYVSRSWSLARGSNAPFRLVQLSVGMEHAAGSRWMVQAEPFVKMPLGSVGFGQIKLSSAGLLLGVKYGLFRPRPTAP
ncbi:hypothetical protein [Hymenobacter perfusus]|uniref:Outer membrane protein beta-barrel domain-containing protein n=1 Tax=Hymenobacter perfusus TaxID=1236770 RepID=A0A3R9MMV1_9BACT|nr:hypothetical protein [Hymenobacter perfusus]RSK45922.1 hypothetical protein EI293_01750 [Hymenobacter perfusus]